MFSDQIYARGLWFPGADGEGKDSTEQEGIELSRERNSETST